MTVVFAATELEAFVPTGGILVSGASSRRDTNFSRSSFRPQAADLVQADFTPLTEGWLHITINVNTILSGVQDEAFIVLQDSGAGFTVMQIDGINGVWNLEVWNGVNLTRLQPNLIIPNDNVVRVDMNWKIANSGFFRVYVNNVFVTSFEGDTLLGAVTQIDRLLLRASSTQNSSLYNVFFSEIIVATQDTIGWRLATLAPDGVGNSTTWSGDHTDINSTSITDGTFVSSGTAEEVEQFTVSNLSGVAAALDVEAVVVAARSRNTGAGPQNIQLGIRTDGQDFFGSTISLGGSFAPFFEIFEQNPDTAADWTSAEIDALEIGMKSKP